MEGVCFYLELSQQKNGGIFSQKFAITTDIFTSSRCFKNIFYAISGYIHIKLAVSSGRNTTRTKPDVVFRVWNNNIYIFES